MFNLVLFLSLCCFNVSSLFASSPFTEEVVFAEGISHLNIAVDDGNITIISQEGPPRVKYSPDQEEFYAELKVRNGTLIIKNQKKDGGCSCDYEIYIPGKTKIDASVGSSDMKFFKLTGDINLNLGSGSLEFDDVDCNIEANCGSGTINYRPALSKFVRNFILNAGSVNLNCFFPKNTSVKSLPRYTFMAHINSSVSQVIDGSHNFVLGGSIGEGNINMTYLQSHM